MAEVPKTSTTLLKALAVDAQHARWGEFVARYRPLMESYMREHFPTVDAEDAIQETLIALIKIFPMYRYAPEEKGAFHNYLTGVLRHKSLKMIHAEHRRNEVYADYGEHICANAMLQSDDEEDAWRKSLFEIALQQFIVDESVSERTKQVFLRVAVNGEKPETVAEAFGISRNTVDQIKSRTLVRMRELVNALEAADEAALGRI